MRKVWLYLSAVVVLWMTAGAQTTKTSAGGPGCAHVSAKKCVDLALEAMGGSETLQQIKSVRLENIGHTLLENNRIVRNHSSPRMSAARPRWTWPISACLPKQNRPGRSPTPTSRSRHHFDRGTPMAVCTAPKTAILPVLWPISTPLGKCLALGPARLLLTASDAPDLHFEAPTTLRSTSHTVVAFTWQKDSGARASQSIQPSAGCGRDYPGSFTTSGTSGAMCSSASISITGSWLRESLFPPTWSKSGMASFGVQPRRSTSSSTFRSTTKHLVMDAKVAKQSAASPGWNRPFQRRKRIRRLRQE